MRHYFAWSSLALSVCVGSSGTSALAAVLPPSVIDRALASAPGLHRQRIANTTNALPYYKLGGSDAQGFLDPNALDYGYLRNGADLLIVPLISGGSGGVFSTLLFTAVRSKPAFLGPLGSNDGHLDIYLQGGRIVVRTPVYRKNDPNCCPSAHRVTRYTLERGKLKKLDEYTTP